MTHIYAVYSAGGFGREIMPALQANYRANDVEFVFVSLGLSSISDLQVEKSVTKSKRVRFKK